MEKIIEKLGLTPKEAFSFLELVALGPSPISVWAKQAGINRSSMYVLLERLKSQKLITTFTDHGVLHAQAIPMSELPALLSDQQEELNRTRELLIKNLPELQQLEKNHGLIPKVTFYEGVSRIESMYKHVLSEKSFLSYFHPGRIKKYLPEYFYKIPESIKKNGGMADELLVACPEATEYYNLYNSKRHKVTILPANVSFSSDTIITTEKIFMVGYNEKTIVGTEIWNRELAHTQSTIFNLIKSSKVLPSLLSLPLE